MSFTSAVNTLFLSKRSEFFALLEKEGISDDKINKLFTQVFEGESSTNPSSDIEKLFCKALSGLTLESNSKDEETNVKIILNIGTKNHGLIGDLPNKFTSSFKGKDYFSRNSKISGWNFSKEKLEEIETKLNEFNIKYTKENKKVEKKTTEHEEPPKKEEPKKLSKKEDPPKKDTKKDEPKKLSKKEEPQKKEVPPKKEEPKKDNAPSVKTNKFGNKIESGTGIVFNLVKLPCGDQVKKRIVAFGIQDETSKEKGIKSLLPLKKEHVEICKKRDLKYVSFENPEFLNEIKKNEPELAKELAFLVVKPKEKEKSKEKEKEEESDEESEYEEDEEEESDEEDEEESDGEEDEEEEEESDDDDE